MRRASHIRAKGRGGNAIIEVTLLLPWIFFLFLAIFNFGFYSYALISVENAARAAAMYTSGSTALAGSGQFACNVAVEELRSLPGIGADASCNCTGSSCTAGASNQLGVFAQVLPSAVSPDGDPAAEVAITYQTIDLFPLPWIGGKMTFTRVARMRI